jgi:hypothetical protein
MGIFTKTFLITVCVQVIIAIIVGLYIKFFYYAIRTSIIKWFIYKNVDIKKLTNNKLLNMNLMIFDNDIDGIKLLIHAKIDPNTEFTLSGGNSIYVAAQENKKEILKLLLDANGDPELGNRKYGSTPLTIAVNYNCQDAVHLLLNAKADPDKVQTNYGETPLFISITRHNYTCFKSLIEHKANVNLGNIQTGQTPLFLSVYNSRFLMTNYLIKAGANMDVVDETLKMTPLSCAVYNNKLSLVKTLVEAGADINMTGDPGYSGYSGIGPGVTSGITPLTRAEIMGYTECYNFIKELKERKENEKLGKALNENCPICIETMDSIELMHITGCYHVFHKECWNEYEATGKNECPICRKK